jgi:Holliday junction resolvase - archaeal type
VARNTTRQGAQFELDVMHALEEHGYTCLRSSGSRGAVDVVAVGPLRTYECGAQPDADLLFIQCKITNPVIPPAERLAVQDLALRAGALPVVAYRAQDPNNARRKTILYRELTGPGPKDWVPWAPGEEK